MSEARTRHDLARMQRREDLARAVPLLPPQALHALILERGLQDAGELLALATPEQLSAVFDLDLWRADVAGGDERLDGTRFCEWLEVLADLDTSIAAARLAELDPSLVVAGLSSSVLVMDLAVFSPLSEPTGADPMRNAGREYGLHAEIGGYLVVARQPIAFEAIADVLRTLEEEHGHAFHRVMLGCRKLSNCGWEVDGLDELLTEAGQLHFDLSVARDERREGVGFVTAQQARAFLHGARHFSLIEEPPRQEPASPADQALQLSCGTDVALDRQQEFAFLANTLVAGCSIMGRSFAHREAIDAIAATCNLGIAHWPTGWAAATTHKLRTVFQVGWTVLHRDVSLTAGARLLEALEVLRPCDRDAQFELHALAADLRRQQQAGCPWRVRGRLDVLAPFDLLASAALTALFDECPVMLTNVSHRGGALHAVDPTAFQFVASREHIAAVHDFLRSIPDLLA